MISNNLEIKGEPSYSFSVRFEFKNLDEVIEAQKGIKKYAKNINPIIKKEKCFVKRWKRLHHIIELMKPNQEYLVSNLYKSLNRHLKNGYKTFTRDICILILQNKIKVVEKKGKKFLIKGE